MHSLSFSGYAMCFHAPGLGLPSAAERGLIKQGSSKTFETST